MNYKSFILDRESRDQFIGAKSGLLGNSGLTTLQDYRVYLTTGMETRMSWKSHFILLLILPQGYAVNLGLCDLYMFQCLK